MDFNYLIYPSIILISFYLLIKSSDFLISSASILGRKIGISKFVIGLTLIAIGTSLPELFTAIFGILDSSNNNSALAFVFGTIIGSNIANILLVFSVFLFFSKKIHSNVKYFDLFSLSLSTFLLAIIILNEELNYVYSIIFLILFFTYLFISVKFRSKKEFEEEAVNMVDEEVKNFKSISIQIIIFFTSLIFLNLSAKGVVYGIENFGILMSIPINFLTFTTVAFATSLPEIIVTYTSAKKNEFNLAIGNIIGSNISNILFILGIAGLIKKMTYSYLTYINSIYFLSFITLLFILLLMKKKLLKPKIYSIIFFSLYIFYLIIIFKL